jgi:oligopeptide transport system ATP-binding protein
MRQRVMIAIAIAMNPRLMVADEPTTALDVTIQSQILGTLKALNRERDMALILITHDMGIVASMASRVIVMYGGRIVESGSAVEIFESARHPYTRALLAAVPRLDKETDRPLEYIVGSPPDMIDPPAGCPFAPRCRYSMRVCHEEAPPCVRYSSTHEAHCFLSEAGAADSRAQFERDYAVSETEARP